MSVTVSVYPENVKHEDPFFNGNVVSNNGGDMVILVIGNSELGSQYFSGVRIAGGTTYPSETWLRHMFKQFVGKVTIEGFL